jgi:predicted RNase H-related nuclease YkuK (DUF458 family)
MSQTKSRRLQEWTRIEAVESGIASYPDDIRDWVTRNTSEGCEVCVGTDSQQRNGFTNFATVIVIRKPGSGAIAIQSSWRVPYIRQLRQRLLEETLASIEVAIELTRPNVGESFDIGIPCTDFSCVDEADCEISSMTGHCRFCVDCCTVCHFSKEDHINPPAYLPSTGPLAGCSLKVHIDANIDERFASSNYAGMLVGLVEGHGFSVVLKPDSWASTTVADRVVKS